MKESLVIHLEEKKVLFYETFETNDWHNKQSLAWMKVSFRNNRKPRSYIGTDTYISIGNTIATHVITSRQLS